MATFEDVVSRLQGMYDDACEERDKALNTIVELEERIEELESDRD